MKSPKLRQLKINRKIKLKEVRKIERDIDEIIHDAFMDIKWYLKKDIIAYLKKKGIIYAKAQTTNKKKKKR